MQENEKNPNRTEPL